VNCFQARKQHKGFEKLLALGGLWEIVKGKGKAITPAPFWVWEGLATHTPAAAELAAQAADVASAARYFEVTLSLSLLVTLSVNSYSPFVVNQWSIYACLHAGGMQCTHLHQQNADTGCYCML